MKKRFSKLFLLASITLSLIVASCTTLDLDDVKDNIDFETSLAVPIGSMHATIADILNAVDSNYIATDSANNIYLLWSEKDLQLNFDPKDFTKGEVLKGMMSLKTLSPFDKIFPLIPGDSVKLKKGVYPFQKVDEYIFGYNEYVDGEKEIYVDSIVISKATVDLEVFVEGMELNDSCYLTLDFNYPEIIATETNDTLDAFHLTIKKNHSTYNSELHHVKTFFPENDTCNSTKLVLNFKLINNGKEMPLAKDAKIRFNTQIKFIDFDEVYGLMWQKKPYVNTEVIEDIPTEFFNTELIKNNKLLFSDPEVEFVIKNNIGVPIRCEVSDVYATDENGKKIYAQFANKSNTFQTGIKIPKAPYDTTHTIAVLNRENGGTNKLFEFTPKKFSYTWKIYSAGPSSDGIRDHFLVNPFYIKVDINAKIPFKLDPGSQFTYKDTIAADMSTLISSTSGSASADSINVELNINKLNFHIDAKNSLPTNIKAKLTYLDESNNIIEGLKPIEIMLPSAQVDEEGRVTIPKEESFTFENTQETLDAFLKTKKISVETFINGFDESSKIYLQTTNGLDIRLSTFINANATSKNNN